MIFLCTVLIGCCGWLAFYEPQPVEPAAPVAAPHPVVLTPEALQRLVGDYELGGEVWTIALRDGRLVARNRDSAELELLTVSPNSLVLRDNSGQLTVVEDRNGRVTGLALTQNGRERTVRRLR